MKTPRISGVRVPMGAGEDKKTAMRSKGVQMNQSQNRSGTGLLQAANNAPKKVKSPIAVVREMMSKSESQLLKVLETPEKVARFTREFYTLLQNEEHLLACTPKSLIGVAIQSAQLGLSLDKVRGLAYVVPYKGIATFQIGYQGYIELARRSGEIKNIFANIVYEGDYFVHEYTINGPVLVHKPVSPSKRGNRIGVYMVANFTTGGNHAEFMWSEEVEKIKKIAPGASRSDSPWKLHEDAMWKKTAIKRSSPYLPLSVEARYAVKIDELQDANIKTVDFSPLVDGNEPEYIETEVEQAA